LFSTVRIETGKSRKAMKPGNPIKLSQQLSEKLSRKLCRSGMLFFPIHVRSKI